MCHADCCCSGETKSGLMNLLIAFTIINLILSVVAIFIRAAKTQRYDEALEYLEAINNGNLDSLDLNNCNQNLFDDDIYCNIDGKTLKKPSQSVKNQGIFKNWNKIELSLNISRTVITVPFLAFLIYVINKRNMERFNLITIFVILLIVVSGLWIVIRALAISANQDIGLYEDGEQNAFEEKIAINYIFDIIEIVLYSIEICFIIRIKRPAPPAPIIVQPPPQPVQPVIVGAVIERRVAVGVFSDEHILDKF
jgi:hypothetical protein